MKQHKLLALFVAVAVVGVVAAVPVAAEEMTTTTEQKTTAALTTEEKRKLFEQKKAELRAKAEAKRAEVKEKLSAKRKEICEKREGNVNKIAAKSGEQGQKHITKFQEIEAKVKAFYTEKGLTVDNYDTLVTAVDEKEQAALAAVEVTGEIKLACETEGEQTLGQAVRDIVTSKHTALKEYRTAIKDLIKAVKTAAEAQKTDHTDHAEGEAH